MVLTPFTIAAFKLLRRGSAASMAGIEEPRDLRGSALVIGFGRVGQIASQFLFARGHEVSIIDTDVEMIETARQFGFKVYYGDGSRLDILHAAGAEHARALVVCIDNAEVATRVVELVKAEFAHVPVLARASDRLHAIALVQAGADFHIRETFEAAVKLGTRALETLGATPEEIAALEADIRKRDAERFELELVGGYLAGRALFSSKPLPPRNANEASPET
jgi:glutathione-regulated potassium-efflux system protein KefB